MYFLRFCTCSSEVKIARLGKLNREFSYDFSVRRSNLVGNFTSYSNYFFTIRYIFFFQFSYEYMVAASCYSANNLRLRNMIKEREMLKGNDSKFFIVFADSPSGRTFFQRFS